ncbi:hypothetical protein MMC13_001549 [Lambiella insularis]|nr:hypothetical protein [Lambiella insularis]
MADFRQGRGPSFQRPVEGGVRIYHLMQKLILSWNETTCGTVVLNRPIFPEDGIIHISSNSHDMLYKESWLIRCPNLRSSIAIRINALAQVGGVNSVESFARSWQRAINFHEITPSRASFQVTEDEGGIDHQVIGQNQDEERGAVIHRSLLRHQIEQQGTPPQGFAVQRPDDPETPQYPVMRSPSSRDDDIFSQAALLGSPFGGSYGSLTARLNDSSRQHAARLFREQQSTGSKDPDKGCEPLLVKHVEQEDGKIILAVVGQSTLYQTVLNSTNVLIGVGLLSLPLGIHHAGWLIGLLFLLFAALTTAYTALLLGKCLDLDRSLITFADVAYLAFGSKAQFIIGVLFSLELTAACVALFVLFADSLDALIPGWGILEWKILCAVIMLPLCFVPLRLLGYSSSLGIMCCFSIVVLVFVDGLLKPHTPGSLREPAATQLFPQDWYTLPLSFGLLMSPWGGHSVFPNIYRDMRHPKKYGKSLRATFGFTYLLDLSMAIAGLLMFGDDVLDEVTSNIFMTEGYPKTISILIVMCIAIIPITKIPLNARPIFSTVENFFGLNPGLVPEIPQLTGLSGFSRGLLKVAVRATTTIVILIIAILCPSFDRVMALMGSAFCFTICVILPLAFYLKLFGKDISMKERILDWSLIVISSILAVIGTVWAFLPKNVT